MTFDILEYQLVRDMDTAGICSSCIHFYDEGLLTCCIKNKRWKTVEYNQKCDIESWEGFTLE